MLYLIGVKKGVHLCGNAGTLITHYKSIRKIKEVAKRFAAMYNLDEVYGLQNYSQKLCELNNDEFINYIRKNCVRYV